MKKLDNIPKKDIFNVPDGYFESLPGRIQDRISASVHEKKVSFVFKYKLQYALPLLLLFSIGIVWFVNTRQTDSVDAILASIETEDLVTYLNTSEITTEDLLENIEFSTVDLEEIENEIYEFNVGDVELDNVLNDIDLENTVYENH